MLTKMLASLIWTVQNVIDRKDQMKFKVLLVNWWSLAPEVGSDTSSKKKF